MPSIPLKQNFCSVEHGVRLLSQAARITKPGVLLSPIVEVNETRASKLRFSRNNGIYPTPFEYSQLKPINSSEYLNEATT